MNKAILVFPTKLRKRIINNTNYSLYYQHRGWVKVRNFNHLPSKWSLQSANNFSKTLQVTDLVVLLWSSRHEVIWPENEEEIYMYTFVSLANILILKTRIFCMSRISPLALKTTFEVWVLLLKSRLYLYRAGYTNIKAPNFYIPFSFSINLILGGTPKRF